MNKTVKIVLFAAILATNSLNHWVGSWISLNQLQKKSQNNMKVKGLKILLEDRYTIHGKIIGKYSSTNAWCMEYESFSTYIFC